MAIISDIKADGSGDFSSLQAWADHAATQSNPGQWARVWNLGNPGPVVLSGWAAAPTSTNYPKIFAATQHDGRDAVGAFIQSSSQTVIENHLNYLRVENLRIRHGNQYGILNAGLNCRFAGNLLVGIDSSAYKAGIQVQSAGLSGLSILNNFIVYGLAGNPGAAGAAQAAIYLNCNHSGTITVAAIGDNTIVGTTGMKAAIAGVNSSSGNVTINGFDANILATNLTKVDAGSILTFSGSYNLYSEATIGTSAVGPYAAVDVVVDPAADWKLLAGSPAIDAAASTGQSVDAFGTSRPRGDARDIGAHEFVFTPPGVDSGNGLRVDYWNDYAWIDSSNPPFPTDPPDYSGVEATVDHDNGFPDVSGFHDGMPPGIDTELVAVRWHGYVLPLYTETYTFGVSCDDGCRLWVDGTLVVDQWIDQGETLSTGTIALTEGVKYRIVLEYFNNHNEGACHLRWSSASQSDEIIPQTQLFTDELGVYTFITGVRGTYTIVPQFETGIRGSAAVFNTFTSGARGEHRVGYLSFSGGGRGTHRVLESFVAGGRGIYRISYSSFGSGARGAYSALNEFICGGRGTFRLPLACITGLRGEYRIANNALARYEIYHGLGASPDLTAAPEATFTALPYTTGSLASDTVHHFIIRRRNAWGLLSQNFDEKILDLAGDGTVNPKRPSNPEQVKIVAGPAGTAIVTAQYLYGRDGINAADFFKLRFTVAGFFFPGSLNIAIVKSDGIAKLRYVTQAFPEGKVVHVVVTTYRSADDIESVDVTDHSATVTYLGPAAPTPRGIFVGTQHQQTQ